MRIKKAYRAFGHELSPDETPLEAGLGFAVAWDTDFLGREALEKQQRAPLKKRLASFVLDDPAIMLWGGEPIVSGAGEVLGYTTSATFCPTLGASVAMGYLREGVGDGNYLINNAGTAHTAKMTRRAPIDPKRERILC
jgi:4-methylaminobutanoate oxidase (formaldehyde-forming)